jgi:hypothetical protein
MIIKRWDTTLNSGAGGWKAISPKVTFTDIVADVTAGTPVSIFENGKLKIGYLPDAVFDSLLFQSTLNPSGGAAADEAAVASALDGALYSVQNIGRSLIGSYFVMSANGTINQQVTAAVQAIASNFDPAPYWLFQFKNNDAGSTSVTSSGVMEAGDWMVIENITGSGTSASPYTVSFSVVSNTYELMTGANGTNAGAPGLVPTPAAADNVKFLRGDATWVTPTDTNTTYSVKVSTQTGGAGVDLDAGGSGSGTDTVKILGSGATTVSRTDADTITVSSANTTYSVSAEDHETDTASKYVRLTGSDSTTDDIRLTAGSGLTIARNGDQVIYSADLGVGLTTSSNDIVMEYPIAVKTTAPAAAYEVSNAIWFDLEVL